MNCIDMDDTIIERFYPDISLTVCFHVIAESQVLVGFPSKGGIESRFLHVFVQAQDIDPFPCRSPDCSCDRVLDDLVEGVKAARSLEGVDAGRENVMRMI